MSIFGTTCPAFQYLEDEDPAMVSITLLYGIIESSEVMTNYLEQESQIDGEREMVPRGTHWRVVIKYHLFKHTTNPTPTDMYNTLCEYKGKRVYLWLHQGGRAFYHTGYTKAGFCLKEVNPYYLDTVEYRDVCTLVFESLDTINQGNPTE